MDAALYKKTLMLSIQKQDKKVNIFKANNPLLSV